jgi:N,N'-diacetyllegionaminate synthase
MRGLSIIAEVAQAHDGSLGILHSYIDALATTGVTTVKFQMHIAEAESSIHEPFRVKFSYEDNTRFDYWKRMEFTFEQWKEIKSHCDDVGLEFLVSPFSLAAVDALEQLNVSRYKIGSGEVSNLLILEKIAQTEKPVILSSGMSSYSELDAAVNYLKERNVPVSVMQCTTSYPTVASQIGLNVLSELKLRYGIPTGLSDHSGTIYPCIGAAALGASLFEFHVVFDKLMFGPDSKSSLVISEVAQVVEGIKFISEAIENPVDKSTNEQFLGLKKMFEKSLAVNKDLKAGHVLCLDDLETKKPRGFGLDASKYSEVIGCSLKRDLNKWDFLKNDDVN